MRGLLYFGLAVLVVVGLVVLVYAVRRGWSSWTAGRREQAKRDAPWRVYREPVERGGLVVGVQRAWQGEVLQRIPVGDSLSADLPEFEVALAVNRATMLADRFNEGGYRP